jgi:hypothetical protein
MAAAFSSRPPLLHHYAGHDPGLIEAIGFSIV